MSIELGSTGVSVSSPEFSAADPKRKPRLPPGPRMPKVIQAWHMSSRMPEFLERCARDYGDCFKISMPGIPPQVMFSQPEAVRQIFTGDSSQFLAGQANTVPLGALLDANSVVLLDGPQHSADRHILLSALRGERIERCTTAICSVAERSIERWPKGQPFQIFPELFQLTLQVVLQTVFGLDETPELKNLKLVFTRLIANFVSPLLLAPWLRVNLGFLTPWRSFLRLKEQVSSTLLREIASRRMAARTSHDDVISILIDARDDRGKCLTDEQIRDELLTLLATGSETTSTALAWALYHIAQNSLVQHKLDAELDLVVGKERIEPTHLPKLKFLDAVIKETLRLNPVILAVVRVLNRAENIAGYDLPAGVLVAPCSYLSHRRPQAWPEPMQFCPERFLDRSPTLYTYFPFGGGDRRCIGMSFATLELKIVLAQVMRRLKVRPVPGYKACQVRRSLTFAPSEGLPIVTELHR
jgi:cytochrome P450